MTINEIQDQIIEEFTLLDGDMEMSNIYLMELGQKMPEMSDDKKTDNNLVKGCQSKVWLTAELNKDKIVFNADSNTAITKGLVSMLIRIFSGQSPEDIIHSELYFIEKIGMNRFVGTQRSNGFGAMIKQMKLFAIALQATLSKEA